MKNGMTAKGTLGVLLLGLAVVACQGAPAEGDERLAQSAEDLLIRTGPDPTLWSKNTLSVCWTSMPASQSAARTWAQDQVTKTWAKKAGIVFTGWGLCSGAGADINISPQDIQSGSGCSSLNCQDGLKVNIWLNLDFVMWGDRCPCSAAGLARENQLLAQNPSWALHGAEVAAECRAEYTAESCVRSTAVHEFGHALGFGHEQDRADNPHNGGSPNASDIYVGAYDLDSVMNYDNPRYQNYGLLSASDVAGARLLYGWGGDQPAPGNYDHTGPSDLVIFRPSTGTWWSTTVNHPSGTPYQYGQRGDIAVPGNYDGVGGTDFALFRPTTGMWYIITTTGSVIASGLHFGQMGDIPVSGDFDGDGTSDLALWRPTTHAWYVYSLVHGTLAWGIVYGETGDTPVSADFDGDGSADLALWRPDTGEWFGRKISGPATLFANTVSGVPGDVPLAADFDGDHRSELVIWRPSEAAWYIRSADGAYLYHTLFGANGDVPMLADYNSDGHPDLGVWRPSNATWYGATVTGTPIFNTAWGQSE